MHLCLQVYTQVWLTELNFETEGNIPGYKSGMHINLTKFPSHVIIVF